MKLKKRFQTTSPNYPTSFASGRYQVKEVLGEGGKKKVYLAQDTLLDESPAISSEIGMWRLRQGPVPARYAERVMGRPTSLGSGPLEVAG